MKKASMWYLIGLLSLGSAASSLAQGTRSTEEAVVRLERLWFEAQATRNPALLAPLLADKVVIAGSEGKVINKTEVLDTCKSTKWDSIRLRDTNLTVFGNTVVATGDFKGEGTDTSGKPLDVHERWTHIWVKTPNGQWQCCKLYIATQDLKALARVCARLRVSRWDGIVETLCSS
jgi:ketosteroid isomerase-like protein